MRKISPVPAKVLQPDDKACHLVRSISREADRARSPSWSSGVMFNLFGLERVLSHRPDTFTGTQNCPNTGKTSESIKEPLSHTPGCRMLPKDADCSLRSRYEQNFQSDNNR